MTATDELRRLLDERGVEHGWAENQPDQTWWKDQDGHIYFAKGINNPMFFNLTPAQAIAATLGTGTCHKVRVHMQIEDEMHCSECGRFLCFAGDAGAPPCNFCPNCGAKVVGE